MHSSHRQPSLILLLTLPIYAVPFRILLQLHITKLFLHSDNVKFVQNYISICLFNCMIFLCLNQSTFNELKLSEILLCTNLKFFVCIIHHYRTGNKNFVRDILVHSFLFNFEVYLRKSVGKKSQKTSEVT